MKNERETRVYHRLVLRKAQTELRLARLRKRLRSEDTHRKYRIGGIGALVGWNELTTDEMEQKAKEVRLLVMNKSIHPDLRKRGQLFYAEQQKKTNLPTTAFVSPGDMRSQRRRQIILGALLLKSGLDNIDRAIVTGAVLLVNERRSFTSRK